MAPRSKVFSTIGALAVGALTVGGLVSNVEQAFAEEKAAEAAGDKKCSGDAKCSGDKGCSGEKAEGEHKEEAAPAEKH